MDAKVSINEVKDELKDNAVRLVFEVEQGERVKISDIVILGNRKFSDRKLKKQMKDTKEIGTIFKKSKYVRDDYNLDKDNIIAHYNKNGYRDAAIVSDTVVRRSDGNLIVFLTIEEGEQYYYRDIAWKGNSKYTDEQLSTILGIKAGDVYNLSLIHI